jgi:NAD-dependent deacetylase
MGNAVRAVKAAIQTASKVTVLTGAGISAESGVPTFRGDGGLWRNFQATELATPEAFARNPELVWEFYNYRRDLVGKVTFNPAHRALAEMEDRVPGFTLITQNIDGLHARAGSRNILELHGNLWKVRCLECGEIREDHSPNLGTRPVCTVCRGPLRPHVVWFGESLDPHILEQALHASRDCQVMLVIGTSAVVQPAASMALQAKAEGVMVVEINLERTPQSDFMNYTLLGKAGEIVPKLVEDGP